MINEFVPSINVSYSQKEKALPLPDSKGEDKSRIHLFDFYGEQGTDRFAIAAEIIHEKSPPKLGWMDKKFYIVAELDGTTYKINKSSLCKRLEISNEELKQHTKGGVAKDDFNSFIKTKLNSCIYNDFVNHASALSINKLIDSPKEFTETFNKIPEIEKNAMAKHLVDTAYKEKKLETLNNTLESCNDRNLVDLFEHHIKNSNVQIALGKLEISVSDFEEFISKFPTSKKDVLVKSLVTLLSKDHMYLALQKTLTELENKKSPSTDLFKKHYNENTKTEAAKNHLSIEKEKNRRRDEIENHFLDKEKSPTSLKGLFAEIPPHEFSVAANSIVEFLYQKDPETLKKSIEGLSKTDQLLGTRLNGVYKQLKAEDELIAKQRAEHSAIAMQNIMRGVIAKRALDAERKHQLSSELIGRVRPLLTDESLKTMSVAIQGAKRDNIKMPKELPVVIRVEGTDVHGMSTAGNNGLRIKKMREAREVIMDNNFKNLVVPKARLQGPFLIEDRLPAVGGHYATMAYYDANHKDLDHAAVEFVSFLMRTNLNDIVGGDGQYMKSLWKYGRPRYDNILVYPEVVDGKMVNKIGLIDLDDFFPSPSWRRLMGAAQDAITLFPYQYDLILAKCGESYKFTEEEIKKLEDSRDVALKALKETVGKHRAFVETHKVSDKPFKIALSDDDQQALKKDMRSRLDENLKNRISIISKRTKMSPEEIQKGYEEKISQSVDKEMSDMLAFFEKDIGSRMEKAKNLSNPSLEEQMSSRVLNINIFESYEHIFRGDNERVVFFNDDYDWLFDEPFLKNFLDVFVAKLVEKNIIANALHPNDHYRLLYV